MEQRRERMECGMMRKLRGMRHGMIWPWTIVTILAVTALLCGCSSAVSPTAASSVVREPTLPESTEYPSEMQPPETVSEPRYETGTRMDDNTEAQTRAISALSHKLPEITVKPEQLMDAGALYPMEYGTDTDVIFFADINHDGEPERITAGLLDLQASGGQDSSLKVLAGESADSPVIWKHDYSLAHAGWSMLYLYREYGADYLLEYSPYMNQGYGAYSLRVFYIGPDNKTVEVHSHTADFAQEDRTGFFGDADALAAFMDTAENYIKNSLLLVSTDQGELAYSTPERPVTLDHDNSFFTDSWNATGKWDGQETIRYMSQKNWMETEGISRLCISRLSGDTVNVQLKNRNHFYTTSDWMMDQLFTDMSGRNWTFLPDQEPPPGPPDAVLSVYRREGGDVFVSCYQKEETAVIWTAPFVYNIANDMRSINECYHMSANAMEHLLSWTP